MAAKDLTGQTITVTPGANGKYINGLSAPTPANPSALSSSSISVVEPSAFDAEGSRIRVEYSLDGGSTWSLLRSTTLASDWPLTHSGLSASTTVDYRFRSETQYTVSDWSTAVSVTTSAASGGATSGTGTAFNWSAPNGVAHGNTLTITPNAGYTIPQRTNVKPYRVELDGNSGHPLGRATDDYRMVGITTYSLTTNNAPGSLSHVWYADVRNMSSGSSTGGTATFNFTVPLSGLIDYQERYYGWDFIDQTTWSPNGAPGGPNNGAGNNLKTNRWWGAGPSLPDVYIGYQAGDNNPPTNTTGRIISEIDTAAAYRYIGTPIVSNQWVSEDIRLYPSSSPGTADGVLQQIRNNVLLSPNNTNLITQNSSYPNAYSLIVQDEISNGPYPKVLPMYNGYRCVDDEHPAIYIGDASTVSACTRLVRQPQNSWPTSANQSAPYSCQLVESVALLSGAYAYVLTAKDTWLDTNGVALP